MYSRLNKRIRILRSVQTGASQGSWSVGNLRSLTPPPKTQLKQKTGAGIFKQSIEARNRVEIGLSYRPARLHRLAELVTWNQVACISVGVLGLQMVL